MRISDWSSDVCSSDLASFLTIASIRHRPTVSDPDSGDRRHIAQVSNKAPWGRRPGNLYEKASHNGTGNRDRYQALLRNREPTGHWRWCSPRHSPVRRSEENTTELKSLMRISYAVIILTK